MAKKQSWFQCVAKCSKRKPQKKKAQKRGKPSCQKNTMWKDSKGVCRCHTIDGGTKIIDNPSVCKKVRRRTKPSRSDYHIVVSKRDWERTR